MPAPPASSRADEDTRLFAITFINALCKAGLSLLQAVTVRLPATKLPVKANCRATEIALEIARHVGEASLYAPTPKPCSHAEKLASSIAALRRCANEQAAKNKFKLENRCSSWVDGPARGPAPCARSLQGLPADHPATSSAACRQSWPCQHQQPSLPRAR